MLPELFVLVLGLALAALFLWAFKNLPKERWQVIGCLLGEKSENGIWKGLNLTYYGFLSATAYGLAAAVFLILLGSLSVPADAAMILLSALLAIGMPASALIARWIEGKASTFTVGGASFAVLLAAPWAAVFIDAFWGSRMGRPLPVLSVLAALSIAYAIGEGIGRLACISFGCCYGKPLSACHPLLKKIFTGRGFVFSGQTKKIAYAHHLDGQEVVPIQAVTAVLLTATGVAGCYAFLRGFPVAAFCGTLVVTQLWRVLSEFFRADFRGKGRISAYQIMSLLSILYAIPVLAIFPLSVPAVPDLSAGMAGLWDPSVLLFLETLWVIAFIHTGRSRVTAAKVRLHVVRERI
jgi:prolipoprotein diacylglyceryltransferase